MELEGRRPIEPTINLSALIDIVFILVIFVVLAANFQRLRGLEVNLPRVEGGESLKNTLVVVTVPRDGPIQIQDKTVETERIKDELVHLRREHDRLVLRSDGEAAFERAVRVLSDARIAGFEAVSIATVLPEVEE